MTAEEQDSGSEGYNSLSSLSEVKEFLNADLSPQEYEYGQVFWLPQQQSEFEQHHDSDYRTEIKGKAIASNPNKSKLKFSFFDGSRRVKAPSLESVVLEIMEPVKLQSLIWPLLEPMIRRAVKEEIQYVSQRMYSGRSVAQAKHCSNATVNSKQEGSASKTGMGKRKTGLHLELNSETKTERGKRKIGFHLELKDLEPHYGKKLKEVQEELGVGRSTIKRICRYYGINRWPCNEKHKKNPSLFETENVNHLVEDSQLNMLPSSSGDFPLLDEAPNQNVQKKNIGSTQHLTVQPEDEKVIVKAKYEDDVIKFPLYLSSGMDKIVEEVARRLNLMMGSFKLKYLDEDNDEVLLVCDDDLQFCLKSLTAVGKTCLELFVQLIRK